MTIPLRPARRTPRIAVLPGLIRTRTARRTSPRRGFRLLQRPHRRRARQLPRSSPRKSHFVDRYPRRGNGRTLSPWPRLQAVQPPPVRCRCRAPARRPLPPKRPIRRSSPLTVTGRDSIATAKAK
jgi:hypothetical protein